MVSGSEKKVQSSTVKVSALVLFVHESNNYFQAVTMASATTLTWPRWTKRSKPISAVDLDFSDSNNSDLDDDDLKAIAETKQAFKLRNDFSA